MDKDYEKLLEECESNRGILTCYGVKMNKTTINKVFEKATEDFVFTPTRKNPTLKTIFGGEVQSYMVSKPGKHMVITDGQNVYFADEVSFSRKGERYVNFYSISRDVIEAIGV